MKKILFIISTIVIIFLIYICYRDVKMYYFSITDLYSKYGYYDYVRDYLDENDKLEKYVGFDTRDYSINDLVRMLDNNDEVDNIKIKNILIKSDLVTISIGYRDIINNLDKYNIYELNKEINDYLSDLDYYLGIIRKYCKEKILFIGYYKDDQYTRYLNNLVKDICDKYNIVFVDISDISLINNEGNHIIFNRIRKIIE